MSAVAVRDRQDEWPMRTAFADAMCGRDPDALMMRNAQNCAGRLRAVARLKTIDLDGDAWIDPARLNPETERLCEIFGQLNFTPAYLQWREERTARTVAALCANDMFRDLCRHWHGYDDAALLDKVGWLSKVQQYAFAEGTMVTRVICVSGINEPKTADPDHPRVVRGGHMHPEKGRRTHDVVVNFHDDAQFREFFAGMETVFHENLHAVQWGLAEALVAGRIAADHPLYREARLFLMAALEELSYIHGVDPVYKAHPLEQDAFEAGPRFVEMLKDGMEKAGIRAPGLN